MLCVDSTVELSSFSTNWVGEPWMLLAPMVTVTLPVTVEPFAGLEIDAPSGVPPPPTITVTVGGLTLLTPRLSRTVSETVYVPGFANVTGPGVATLLVAGEPPGKIQW